MSARAESLGPYFTELEAEAKELADRAGQAAQHYADGDNQWAYNLLNLLTHNVGTVEDLRDKLAKDFEAMGFQPGFKSEDASP
jgi:pterin-4a-carbinolamine dehydratase